MKKIVIPTVALMSSIAACTKDTSSLKVSSPMAHVKQLQQNPDVRLEFKVRFTRGTRRQATKMNSEKECDGRAFCVIVDIGISGGMAGIAGGATQANENINDFEYNATIIHDPSGQRTFRVYNNDINAACKAAIFEGGYFEMDEDYAIPEWVNEQLHTNDLILPKGQYAITQTDNYAEFNF